MNRCAEQKVNSATVIFYQHQIGQVKVWLLRGSSQDSIAAVSHFNTAFKESSLEYADQCAVTERQISTTAVTCELF